MRAPQPSADAPGALRTLLTGAAMGAADLVPGFSGGTVALVAGVYPRLVANIRGTAHVLSLALRFRFRGIPEAVRSLDLAFMGLLLGSIIGAALLLASTLDGLLETQPVVMSAVFLGLVLGAAVVARHQLRRPADARTVALVVASALVTAVALGARPAALADPGPVVLALTVAVAVCAMILPGVSGSFLLLVLGTYEPIIAGVSDRDLVVIGLVGLGAVSGLLAFSTLLNWLLARAHDVVLALLIGLMVGSARVLWPWPSAAGVGDPTVAAPDGDVLAAAVAAAVALVAVVLVDRVLRRAGAPTGARSPSGPSPHGTR